MVNGLTAVEQLVLNSAHEGKAVEADERISVWRRIGAMLGLTGNAINPASDTSGHGKHQADSFEPAEDELDEDDAAAQIIGKQVGRARRTMGDVDDKTNGKMPTAKDTGPKADDHANPPNNPRAPVPTTSNSNPEGHNQYSGGGGGSSKAHAKAYARGMGQAAKTEDDAREKFPVGSKVKTPQGDVREVRGHTGSTVHTWSEQHSGTMGNDFHHTKLTAVGNKRKKEQDGICPDCGMPEDECECDETENQKGCTMNADQIERLMELPFIIQGMTNNAERSKFSKFITTNMPAGGAFAGAKEAGYSPEQAAAMAGKLEGSYGGSTSKEGDASRAADKAGAHADKTKSKSAHTKAAAAHREAASAHKEAGNADKASEHGTKARSYAAKSARMARNELNINQLVESGVLTLGDAPNALSVLNAKAAASFSEQAPDDDTTEESDSHDDDGVAHEDGAASDYADKTKGKTKAKGAFTGNQGTPTMNAAQREKEWLKGAPAYIRDQVVNQRRQMIDALTVNAADDNIRTVLKNKYAAMTTDELSMFFKAMPTVNQHEEQDVLAGAFPTAGGIDPTLNGRGYAPDVQHNMNTQLPNYVGTAAPYGQVFNQTNNANVAQDGYDEPKLFAPGGELHPSSRAG